MNDSNISYEQFGVHFMLDGYGASKDTLRDKEKLHKMLLEIPKSMGMHTISEPVVVEVGPKNRKDPGGLSGFVLIAESHISFHTFPERRFVTIDVYTCQNILDTNKLLSLFTEAFELKETDTYVQQRGLRYPSENLAD
jgi:S-adenosylmethionine decarboxylase